MYAHSYVDQIHTRVYISVGRGVCAHVYILIIPTQLPIAILNNVNELLSMQMNYRVQTKGAKATGTTQNV